MTEYDPEALTRMVDQMRAGHYSHLTISRTSRLREITTQGTGR
ncbi:hypothetical protein [Klenkia marina]|nr:hypothetical protein [Klenkia marina]